VKQSKRCFTRHVLTAPPYFLTRESSFVVWLFHAFLPQLACWQQRLILADSEEEE